MPLDVLGRTRATLTSSSRSPYTEMCLGNLFKASRAGDRLLQLLIFNEEFLVNASHQLALITSLPFVHTARRYYRLNDLVSCRDRCLGIVYYSGTVGNCYKLDHLEEVKVVTRRTA